MAKQIKQFRYYSEDEEINNSPIVINKDFLVSGKIFESCMPIYKLGIQAITGTTFYLNGSLEPIIIGNTGIFELDLGGNIEINALKFSEQSVNFINNNINAYLIIDMICEGGE